MRTSRFVLAAILVLAGLVWIGQGSGLLPGSVMSGKLWEVVGIVLLVAGVVIGAREWMTRSSRRPSPKFLSGQTVSQQIGRRIVGVRLECELPIGVPGQSTIGQNGQSER